MFSLLRTRISGAQQKRRAERMPIRRSPAIIPGRRDNDAAGIMNVACAPAVRNMTFNYAVARSFQLSVNDVARLYGSGDLLVAQLNLFQMVCYRFYSRRGLRSHQIHFHHLDVSSLVVKYSTSWPASLIRCHLNSGISGSGRWLSESISL